MKYQLSELAEMPYNNLLFALDSSDARWLELIPFSRIGVRTLTGGLPQMGWNALPKTPWNTSACAERDRIAMDKSFKSAHEASRMVGFHTLQDKRFRDFENKLYKGELKIGHFVGVKEEKDINPMEIKNHRIGEIRKVNKATDGRIISFILNNEFCRPI